MAAGDNTAAVTACVLVALSVCLSAVHAKYDIKDGAHSISLGVPNVYPYYPADVLLFHSNPKVSGSWFPWPKVKSQDLCFPPKRRHQRKITITAFNVTDLERGGKGGYAFVKQGGIGWGKLCLHLKSQRGKGYNFNIAVWGRYL